MEQETLDEIKAREQAATPGPWYTDGWALWDDDLNEFVELHDTDPDAQFLAHARTDIPALLAEVERLTKEYNDQDNAHHDLFMAFCEQKKQIATLKKALELMYADMEETAGIPVPDVEKYINQAEQLTHETHGDESDMRLTQGGKDDSHAEK